MEEGWRRDGGGMEEGSPRTDTTMVRSAVSISTAINYSCCNKDPEYKRNRPELQLQPNTSRQRHS